MSPDADALRQLEKSGSDLSKVHRFEFHVRFPSEDDATEAAMQLEELAFMTTTEHDETEGSWVVLAEKRMYPVESNLAGLREQLKTIAAQWHGVYEGWKASAVGD